VEIKVQFCFHINQFVDQEIVLMLKQILLIFFSNYWKDILSVGWDIWLLLKSLVNVIDVVPTVIGFNEQSW